MAPTSDEVLVLLALLDGHAETVQVGDGRVALDGHRGEVAVRHGVPDVDRLDSPRAKQFEDPPRDAALANARAYGAHADDRLGRGDHASGRADDAKVSPTREHVRGFVHKVVMGGVAVGEEHVIDLKLDDERRELALGVDGDAVRIARAGQNRREGPPVDTRDLSGREGDDLDGRVVFEGDQEVVEVAARRSHDDGSTRCGGDVVLGAH